MLRFVGPHEADTQRASSAAHGDGGWNVVVSLESTSTTDPRIERPVKAPNSDLVDAAAYPLGRYWLHER